VSQNILGSVAILQDASVLPKPVWKPRWIKIAYFFASRKLGWLMVIVEENRYATCMLRNGPKRIDEVLIW
jgi:hypothetical protein